MTTRIDFPLRERRAMVETARAPPGQPGPPSSLSSRDESSFGDDGDRPTRHARALYLLLHRGKDTLQALASFAMTEHSLALFCRHSSCRDKTSPPRFSSLPRDLSSRLGSACRNRSLSQHLGAPRSTHRKVRTARGGR